MNEYGAVLKFKIVPNDTRQYIQTLLEDIWTTPSRTVTTKCVYTDNVRVDHQIILECFKRCHSDVVQLCDVLQVRKSIIRQILTNELQDIFHAENRVLVVLSKTHADYTEASKELKAIFGRILNGSWETIEDLQQAFEDWLLKWNEASTAEKLNDMQKVQYLGIF